MTAIFMFASLSLVQGLVVYASTIADNAAASSTKVAVAGGAAGEAAGGAAREPGGEACSDTGVDPSCVETTEIELTPGDAAKAGLKNKSTDNIVKQTLNGVYTVAAIIAVLVIVLAGIRIITADGDSGKIAAARQTIIYAVVGLAIVGSAFIITGIVQGVGTK